MCRVTQDSRSEEMNGISDSEKSTNMFVKIPEKRPNNSVLYSCHFPLDNYALYIVLQNRKKIRESDTKFNVIDGRSLCTHCIVDDAFGCERQCQIERENQTNLREKLFKFWHSNTSHFFPDVACNQAYGPDITVLVAKRPSYLAIFNF